MQFFHHLHLLLTPLCLLQQNPLLLLSLIQLFHTSYVWTLCSYSSNLPSYNFIVHVCTHHKEAHTSITEKKKPDFPKKDTLIEILAQVVSIIILNCRVVHSPKKLCTYLYSVLEMRNASHLDLMIQLTLTLMSSLWQPCKDLLYIFPLPLNNLPTAFP